jgi:hypothetical protein
MRTFRVEHARDVLNRRTQTKSEKKLNYSELGIIKFGLTSIHILYLEGNDNKTIHRGGKYKHAIS